MASADFCPIHIASSLTPLALYWRIVQTSRNKTHIFRPAGHGFTPLLRLGLGLCRVLPTCPQVGLVSISCSCPPSFVLDFLHPLPRGGKLVFDCLIPPNRLIGDFHSR